jgi:NAD(P)-dependent dehydrogenase (short-subunit alcohol dehydrogenase family)
MNSPMPPAGVRLKGKIILVTGSATGIGEGMARRFAAEGAFVVIHDRKTDPPAVALDLGENACYVAGDLEDSAVPARVVEEAIARCGRLDALVNNAAVMTRGRIEDTDEALFDRTVAIDLKAPFFLIRAAIPHFRRQGGGRILNIGSMNAYCGENSQCIYSVCKGGLMTLTRNLADAHAGEGIRVNQINVGWTLTPNERALKMREGLPEDWPSRLPSAFAPAGRLLSPDEVAAAGVYLLSDEAFLVNGAVLDLEQYPMIGRNPAKEIPK